MSDTAAQYITIITGAILAGMVVAFLLYHSPRPKTVKGIPISGVGKPDYILAAIIVLFFSQGPLMAVLRAGQPPTTFSVSGLVTAYIVQTAIFLPVVWRLKTITPASLSLPKTPEKTTLTLACGFVAIAVTVISSYALSWTGIDQYIMNATDCAPLQDSVEALQTASLPIKISIIFGAVIVAPFVEEFCFRGILYPVLKRCAGAVFAAVATALLFGIIHMSLVQAIPLSIFGLLLVITYEATRTIWAPVLTHMAFNSFMVANIVFFGI